MNQNTMKNIKLNKTVSIDLPKLVAGKLLLQAGSGGGKSWAIRRILEQSFGTIPHLILDTEGEFSTLREKYDYILIGKGLDINADPKTAALLAVRLWKERVSAIIDLYELSPWDRALFVKNFVDAMVNAPKDIWHPVLLVIDEVHEYAPESDKSESGRALHLLASKGRKRNIAVVFATQRISTLSKSVVAACKNKLIGYASETNDVKRAAFELGFTPQEALRLRNLDPGEFYAFGPAISKVVTKLHVGPVNTTHEGSVVTLSRSKKSAAALPASDRVKKVLARLADLPQAAAEEARTVAELKIALTASQRRVREIERQTNAPNRETTAEDIAGLKQRSFNQGLEKGQSELKKFKDALYQKLLKSHGNVFRALEALSKDIDGLKDSEGTVKINLPSPKVFEQMPKYKLDVPEYFKASMIRPGRVTPGTENMMSELEPFPTMGAGERQVLMEKKLLIDSQRRAAGPRR